MRRAVVLVLALAACELQPAPKKQAAPVEVTPPQPPPAQPPQPPPSVADAGVAADAPAPPMIQASEACIKVAAHVVQVFIDTAKDPAQAAVYEQERMKMTKATAEACDRQAWGADAMKCYLLAKDPPTIKACENKFPPVEPKMGSAAGSAALPPPPPPNAGSGAGSAAPKKTPPPAGAGAGSASPKKVAHPATGSGAAPAARMN